MTQTNFYLDTQNTVEEKVRTYKIPDTEEDEIEIFQVDRFRLGMRVNSCENILVKKAVYNEKERDYFSEQIQPKFGVYYFEYYERIQVYLGTRYVFEYTPMCIGGSIRTFSESFFNK